MTIHGRALEGNLEGDSPHRAVVVIGITAIDYFSKTSVRSSDAVNV